MEDDGYFNLGVSDGLEYDTIKRYGSEPGTLVVVIASKRMPHLCGMDAHGGHRFHLSQIDHVIESDDPIKQLDRQIPDDGDARIADYVSDLVEDTATVSGPFRTSSPSASNPRRAWEFTRK